jgi:hypothetical protein
MYMIEGWGVKGSLCSAAGEAGLSTYLGDPGWRKSCYVAKTGAPLLAVFEKRGLSSMFIRHRIPRDAAYDHPMTWGDRASWPPPAASVALEITRSKPIATFAYSSELPAHYLGRRDLGHLGQGTNSRDDTKSDSGMPPG